MRAEYFIQYDSKKTEEKIIGKRSKRNTQYTSWQLLLFFCLSFFTLLKKNTPPATASGQKKLGMAL